VLGKKYRHLAEYEIHHFLEREREAEIKKICYPLVTSSADKFRCSPLLLSKLKGRTQCRRLLLSKLLIFYTRCSAVCWRKIFMTSAHKKTGVTDFLNFGLIAE